MKTKDPIDHKTIPLNIQLDNALHVKKLWQNLIQKPAIDPKQLNKEKK